MGKKIRTCMICGCTDSTPCIGAYGETCYWVGKNICSFCNTILRNRIKAIFGKYRKINHRAAKAKNTDKAAEYGVAANHLFEILRDMK